MRSRDPRAWAASLLVTAGCVGATPGYLGPASADSGSTADGATMSSSPTSSATADEGTSSSTSDDGSGSTSSTACGDGVPTTGSFCFDDGVATALAPGVEPGKIAPWDVDGDGNLDVAVAYKANMGEVMFEWLLGDGTAALTPAGAYGRSTLNAFAPIDLVIADADGDGIADATVVAQQGSEARICTGTSDGAGGFADVVEIVPSQGRLRALAMGDVDGDGAADPIVGDEDASSIYLFESGAPGNPSSPSQVIALTAHEPSLLGLADLDGDDVDDLVVVDTGDSGVGVLRGPLSERSVLDEALILGSTPGGAHPEGLLVTDLDDDGDVDVAVALTSANAIAVLVNDGTGALAFSEIAMASVGPVALGCGDFDGDGASDIVALGSVSNSLTFAYRDGEAWVPSASVQLLEVATDLVVGDIDGDGIDDIVLASSSPALVQVYLAKP